MDRVVFIVVALALLVATQAQAEDPWFNAHCEESRGIMASVRPDDSLPPTLSAPAQPVAPAAVKPVGSGKSPTIRPGTLPGQRKSRA